MPIRNSRDVSDIDKPDYLVSRNVTVAGHRTSIRLEPYMWEALADIRAREELTIHELCTMIDARRPSNGSLTAAIRVFILAYFRLAATEQGHENAGHGNRDPLRYTPFDHAPQRETGKIGTLVCSGHPRRTGTRAMVKDLVQEEA